VRPSSAEGWWLCGAARRNATTGIHQVLTRSTACVAALYGALEVQGPQRRCLFDSSAILTDDLSQIALVGAPDLPTVVCALAFVRSVATSCQRGAGDGSRAASGEQPDAQ
jgi:hypothetical protein